MPLDLVIRFAVLFAIALALGWFMGRDPDAICMNMVDPGLAAHTSEADRQHCEELAKRSREDLR